MLLLRFCSMASFYRNFAAASKTRNPVFEDIFHSFFLKSLRISFLPDLFQCMPALFLQLSLLRIFYFDHDSRILSVNLNLNIAVSVAGLPVGSYIPVSFESKDSK